MEPVATTPFCGVARIVVSVLDPGRTVWRQFQKPEGNPTQCVVECDNDDACVSGLCTYIVDLILVCCHRFNFYQVHVMDRIVGDVVKQRTNGEAADRRNLQPGVNVRGGRRPATGPRALEDGANTSWGDVARHPVQAFVPWGRNAWPCAPWRCRTHRPTLCAERTTVSPGSSAMPPHALGRPTVLITGRDSSGDGERVTPRDRRRRPRALPATRTWWTSWPAMCQNHRTASRLLWGFDRVLPSGALENLIPPTHNEFWDAYIMMDAVRKLKLGDILFETVRQKIWQNSLFNYHKTSFIVRPCSAHWDRETIPSGQQFTARNVDRRPSNDASLMRRTGIRPTQILVVKYSCIVVVQYVNPSVEPSAEAGRMLFDLFQGYNLLVVVRRAVHTVVGPIATQLVEQLLGMRTFERVQPLQVGTVPADLVFPAKWAYDKPAFVSLFNPSATVLLRMNFKRTYRCRFVQLGSKRTEPSKAEPDAKIVARQIHNIMARLPRQMLRLGDTDPAPAVFLDFAPSQSSVELQG